MVNNTINNNRSLSGGTRELRQWQKNAVSHFFALLAKVFLLTATPGGGKTEVVCHIARRLFSEGRIERLVIVVPTEQLKLQWARALAHFGIEVDPFWSNSDCCEAEDFLGVAVTYQQTSCASELYEFHCRQKPTLVVLDEAHHSGETLDWGEKMKTAFSDASFIISLSGTPFRSDSNRIPFVRYEEGKSCSDFSYTYGQALADGVCRPIYFPTFEGEGNWIRRNGDEVTHSIIDNIAQDRQSELFQMMLSPRADWLPMMLREADEKLGEFRAAGHRDAGGLVFAKDQQHALDIAGLLRKITGEEAMVVISDQVDAAQRLKEFGRAGNQKRWLVAVKMVSEGIDIPRLRVGVFATNILSELFFRQAIGRLIRMISGIEEQSAALYLPAHPVLIEHALSIREERDHVLTRASSKPAGVNQIILNQNPALESFQRAEHIFGEDGAGNYFEETDGYFADPNANSFGESFENYQQRQITEAGAREAEMAGAINREASAQPLRNSNSLCLLASNAVPHDTIFDGSRFPADEMRQAEDICRKAGVKVAPVEAAAIIREALATKTGDFSLGLGSSGAIRSNGGLAFTSNPAQTANERTEIIPLAERKQKLRGSIAELANRLANRLGVTPDVVHREWKQKMNGQSADEATADDLERKLDWLKEAISKHNRQIFESRN